MQSVLIMQASSVSLIALANCSHYSVLYTQVLNGRLLDEATGLPIVEYGVDDGVTVLGIPTQDVNRCVNVHVKLPGLPNQVQHRAVPCQE